MQACEANAPPSLHLNLLGHPAECRCPNLAAEWRTGLWAGFVELERVEAAQEVALVHVWLHEHVVGQLHQGPEVEVGK